MHTDVEKEIERLRDQALWAWDKEFRDLQWFGLRDGMSILEVGSGPGFITEQLLRELPNSKVTCLEIDPDMIERAGRYLKSQGLEGRYEIIEGNLMHMDFPDNTFDYAFARLVFQHLPDPVGAAREIARVLKSGGIFVVSDVDSGLKPIFAPEDEEADRLEKKFEQGQEQRGGNRKIGRRLWRIMAEVGLKDMDLEIFAIHSDSIPLEKMADPNWDPGAMEPALKAGIITEEDVEIMHKSHTRFWSSPDRWAMYFALMVRGQKP
jgi:SAM-dependent methyltransferase